MTETFVTLNDEMRSDMAKQMARHWTKVELLRDKKAIDAKRTQGEIDEELEEIGRLCRVINDDGQPRDQMELFAGDSRVTEEAAQQALAALQARQPGCSLIDATSCEIHGACSCVPADDERPEEGKAPAVKALDCTLHGVGAPHATEPPAVEKTEPQIIEALAQEAVAEWARKGITPESRVDLNSRVKEAIAATSMPVRRRKAFREAVARLLSDVPSVPAGAGASAEPAEEPDGNVAEAQA